ncbi:hypothetical protein [Moraxella lacunata]
MCLIGSWVRSSCLHHKNLAYYFIKPAKIHAKFVGRGIIFVFRFR